MEVPPLSSPPAAPQIAPDHPPVTALRPQKLEGAEEKTPSLAVAPAFVQVGAAVVQVAADDSSSRASLPHEAAPPPSAAAWSAAPLPQFRLEPFGLDATGAPRSIVRAPSRVLARPLDAAVERLVPALMRPVLFALTHQVRELSALRPASLGLLPDFSPPPRDQPLPGAGSLQFVWRRGPDRPTLPALELSDLGVARPASFRIDEEGRLPAERDTPATTSERPPPPAPGRYLLPRTPLARAPLSRVDGTAFRLDPRDSTLPNERIIQARPAPQFPSWYLPDYDREIVRRWFPFIYIWGLGPLQTEWFSSWWAEFRAESLGGQMPFPFREDRELMWQIILRCKEQMLLRRDVKKLEEPPEFSEFVYEEQGVHILQHERQLKLAELVDKPAWVEIARIERLDRQALHPWLDAYGDWRALLGGLEER